MKKVRLLLLIAYDNLLNTAGLITSYICAVRIPGDTALPDRRTRGVELTFKRVLIAMKLLPPTAWEMAGVGPGEGGLRQQHYTPPSGIYLQQTFVRH